MRKDCQNLTTFLFLQPCYGHIFIYLNIYIVLSSNIEDIFLVMTYKIIFFQLVLASFYCFFFPITKKNRVCVGNTQKIDFFTYSMNTFKEKLFHKINA